VYATRASGLVRAPRSAVYALLLDPAAVADWRVPSDMTARVHEWSAVEGGRFRVSLAYADASRAGKSAGNVDTYAGRFVRLVPDAEVVEVLAFESADPGLAGEMALTWTLADAPGGTEVTLLHEGVPDAVSAEDNETGTRMALAHLAAYVEGLV
jgi:uncharacterized protein YndB with AHSA1/START domain